MLEDDGVVDTYFDFDPPLDIEHRIDTEWLSGP
jgi:hypothetical protein